jgi:signal transduction histidine kinase
MIQTASSPSRPSLLGGDGFYAVARIALMVMLLAISSLLSQAPLWPPFNTLEPIPLLIWSYVLFAALAAAALLLRNSTVAHVALLIDIGFLTLLTFFSATQQDLFYPLYIVPLVGAALQMHRRTSIIVGILAALGYSGAVLASYATENSREVIEEPLALLALLLRSAVLIAIPWLTSGLAERRSATNRRSVELAEQKGAQALADSSVYRDRMRALYQVAYSLATSPNKQDVLNTTLTEARKLVPYDVGAMLLASGEPDELFVAASYGLDANERQQIIRLGQGAISAALREPEAFLIDDLQIEPVFTPLGNLARRRTACAIPLRAGLQTYGALVVASDHTNAFNDERADMLAALSSYALVALQNVQLIHDLRSERSKLLSKEEEVRHQLARDLHDGPAQALAAITMNVEFIKRMLERDPTRVVSELDKLSALAKRTTHEVRTMLFELRPLALETQGLGTTLKQYFERFQSNTTEITLEAENVDVTLETRTEGTLFNIIQEGVNNALKHARAKHIWVRVRQVPGGIEATVQDDGAGFDLARTKETYEKRGSFGLLNIEERAKLVGGMAELRSAPGEGTTVRVFVPTTQ